MSLLRNFATVGGATATSRVLGFVRDIFIAAALGTGPVADAFFVALRLPNLFRRLFAEGAFNSAFVPLFTRDATKAKGEAEARRFAEEALAGARSPPLIVVTILAEIAMPWLIFALAPGFADDPEKFDLAVLLTRIAFPYLAPHLAGDAALRRPQRRRPLRRRRLRAGAPQRRPDRRAPLHLLDAARSRTVACRRRS